jgi:hypothetical protein
MLFSPYSRTGLPSEAESIHSLEGLTGAKNAVKRLRIQQWD